MLKEKNSIRAIKPKVIKFSKRLLKKECDTVFSMYIRHIRDKDKWCITCWNFDRKMDNWHFQVRQHMATRYSEMNCAKQCCYCNDEFQGEQVKFWRKIDEIYGEWTAEALEMLANKPYKMEQSEYLDIYNRYYNLIKDLPETQKYIPTKKYLNATN